MMYLSILLFLFQLISLLQIREFLQQNKGVFSHTERK